MSSLPRAIPDTRARSHIPMKMLIDTIGNFLREGIERVMMRLQNTTIVVTGASTGLGRRMAEAFVKAGADVICTSRATERLEQLVEQSESNPGEAIAVRCDVRTQGDVESLLRTTEERFDQLDVFINNAGIKESHVTGKAALSVESLPVDAWDAIMATNLRGVFLCTRTALPLLRQSGGRLVHIGSGMGLKGRAGRAAYVTSKFGLEGFHQSVADQLSGTDVESILLDLGGGVDTEGFSRYLDEDARAGRLDPNVIVEPALRLAEGFGSNGGRYVATEVDEW